MNNHNLQQHESRSLSEYWHIILRHKWAIISISSLSAIVGVLIATSMTPIFQADSRLLIVPETQQVLFSDNSLKGAQQTLSFYRTQVEIIRSRSLAAEVINELKLSGHVDYLPEKPSFLKSLTATNENGGALKSKKQKFRDIDSLVSIFNRNLHVQSERNSEIIGIKYEGKDPRMTAKVVNTVSDVYIRRVKKAQEKSNQDTIGWLSDNLEISRKKLVASEAELQQYQSDVHIGDTEEEAKLKTGKYGDIISTLLSVRTKRAEYEIRYQQVQSLPRKIKAYQSLQYVLNNKNVQALIDKKDNIERNNRDLSIRYGNKHPKIISAKNYLKAAKSRVNQEIFKVVDSIKSDYEFSVAQEKEVAKIYEKMQADDRSKKGSRFDLAKLESEVETNKEMYNMLLTKLREADMSTNRGKINVKIIDRAEVPKIAFKPNRKRIVIIAFILGLFGSILLSFFREFNDKTFKTGDSLVEITKLPLLGVFPIISKKELLKSSPERIIIDRPRSTVAESVNNIRTNLMFSSGDQSPQVVMITSAIASEGKTTVSCNLGISLAHLGPTLIIEADTRRPRLRKLLKESEGKGGLFEYIAGKSSLKNSVWADEKVKNLYTLPVKMKPAKPIEFLSSRRFSDSLKLLRKKFKFIIIDTPPVLPVSDAIVLSSIVDGVIMVVGAEKTKHGMTQDALHRLQHVNAPMIGTVLTRARAFNGYGYGDGYSYGYGYSYGNTAY